ncbi:hypothetical protein ACFQ3N_00645 [Virgibacillus byunsanensis]|uniref:Transporter n=1 Tax=Virgibacillus byunsanensis TaxID=570945 RepID=A0ABW3LG87_9BACI
MKNTAKGIGWGALALITCPCHLVLILPLLAGTALGGYLAEYQTITWVVLGLLFIYSFYMAWKKLDHSDNEHTKKEDKKKSSLDCCSPQPFKK